MKRTSLLFKSLVQSGIAILLFIGFSEPTFASVTMTSPTASTYYSNIAVNYTISETPTSGTVTLLFTGAVTRTLILNNSLSQSFTIAPGNLSPLLGNQIGSVLEGVTSIPDGTYTVKLSYQHLGTTTSTPTLGGVVIKTSTNPATLNYPASSSGTYTTSNPIRIKYNFPDAVSSGRQLSFLNTSTNQTYSFVLSPSASTDFMLDPNANLGSNANFASASANSIPDGPYTVSLTYSDSLGNPAATTTNSGVVVKYNTLTPTLTYPAASTSYTNILPINFTAPEMATSGTKTLSLLSGTGQTITLQLSDSGLSSFNLDLSQPITHVNNSNIQAASSTAIPDGTYTATFSYQDIYNNPSAHASNAAISIHTITSTGAPTLIAPASSTTYTDTLPIQFSTPETPQSGSMQFTLFNSILTTAPIVLTLQDSAQTSFNLDLTAALTSNSNILSASLTSIPAGTYSTTFSYIDTYGNPRASSASSAGVVIKYSSTAVTVAPGSSDGGSCLFVQDPEKRKKNSPFEFFFWLTLCGVFVVLQKKIACTQRVNQT